MADNLFKTVSSNHSEANDPLLQYVFIEELKDFFWTEKLLLNLLLKMQKAAHSRIIKKAFRIHYQRVLKQVKNLESTFQYLENKPKFQFFDQMCLFSEGLVLVEDILQTRENCDHSLIILSAKLAQFEQKSFADIIKFSEILGYDKLSKELKISKAENYLTQYPLQIQDIYSQKEKGVLSAAIKIFKAVQRYCF